MTSDNDPKPETISRLFDAVYPSFAMLAGMQLDLFTHLADGPRTAEQLAEALDVQAEMLNPLLYMLIVAGLLSMDGDRFANTPEANHYLVPGGPAFLGGTTDLTFNNWLRVLDTAGTIRAGGPLAKYDYHADDPAQHMIDLFRGLEPGANADARRLMVHHDFANSQNLLDVGGGSGALSIAIARQHPHLKATIAELPSVIPITRRFVAEAGLLDRIEIMMSNAVEQAPSGTYDVIAARHLIQVLSIDDSRALLRNLAACLTPGGTLHILGWILDDSRLTPASIVGYNLILMNTYDEGRAYTESQYVGWLADAGLAGMARTMMPNGTSIITAHKPA